MALMTICVLFYYGQPLSKYLLMLTLDLAITVIVERGVSKKFQVILAGRFRQSGTLLAIFRLN